VILPASAYPEHARVAVGAVVFKQNRVLLVRRASPPAHGDWAIPGGKVRLGETLKQAAEREIFEETGITIQAGEPVFCFDTIERDPGGRVRFHYVIIDLAAEYTHGEPYAGDDALEVRWVAPEELHTLQVSPATLTLLRDRYGFSRAGPQGPSS
jgi:ADP-ribose pyrophosphatase